MLYGCMKGTDSMHLADDPVVSPEIKKNRKLRVLGKRLPVRIQTDNGSEFISKSLDKWAYEQGVTMDFSRPGKPTDNPFIESFNGSLRDECLNIFKHPGKTAHSALEIFRHTDYVP